MCETETKIKEGFLICCKKYINNTSDLLDVSIFTGIAHLWCTSRESPPNLNIKTAVHEVFVKVDILGMK